MNMIKIPTCPTYQRVWNKQENTLQMSPCPAAITTCQAKGPVKLELL